MSTPSPARSTSSSMASKTADDDNKANGRSVSENLDDQKNVQFDVESLEEGPGIFRERQTLLTGQIPVTRSASSSSSKSATGSCSSNTNRNDTRDPPGSFPRSGSRSDPPTSVKNTTESSVDEPPPAQPVPFLSVISGLILGKSSDSDTQPIEVDERDGQASSSWDSLDPPSNPDVSDSKKGAQEEDESTQPETPPGYFRGIFNFGGFIRLAPSEDSDDYSDEYVRENKAEVCPRKKGGIRIDSIICLGCCLFFVLVALAGASAGLHRLNNPPTKSPTQQPTQNPTMSSASPTVTFSPSSQPTPMPSASPSLSLVPTQSAMPTIKPSSNPSAAPTSGAPSSAPSSTPSSKPSLSQDPSSSPSRMPSGTPTISRETLFLEFLSTVSPGLVEKIQNTYSKQYEAFQWLMNDPSYYTYGDSRALQRFILALVSLELTYPTPSPTSSPGNDRTLLTSSNATSATTTTTTTTTTTDSGTRELNVNAMESWRKYDDECFWFTSWYQNRVSCDGDHKFSRLVLTNIGLEGTIPSELALMPYLHTLIITQNEITGTIPWEFGQWTNLRKLNLTRNWLEGSVPSFDSLPELTVIDVGNNLLSGTIPESVCNLPLEFFRADCNVTNCECCTECADYASQSPTRAPTTETPTYSPESDCEDSIEVERDCYKPGEEIVATFRNCDARGNDWVGLYDDGLDPQQLGMPHLWVWSCGDKSCSGARSQGSVVLSSSDQQQPLNEGTYQVFILRRGVSGGPYQSYAATKDFEVNKKCK